jgi:glycosyltransferase involved in cell wall biosynthesis
MTELTSRAPVERLVVAYPDGNGVARWRERHRESPVPSAWPYGLDRLQAHGLDVLAQDLPAPTRAQRLALRLGRPRRQTTPAGDRADVAVSWDELTATRLVTRAPAARLLSGVIWLTDELDRERGSHVHRQQRRVLRSLDGVWCLSRPQVPVLEEWLGEDGPPVHFLKFGIDETFYRFRPDMPQRPKVVSLGGDRDRDPATLFAALELVLRELPDVECVVQSKAVAPPPPGVTKIDFIPHAQARDLYASASVVALATRPNLHVSGMTVGLEAMAVGRPVVACATPGMSDYVDDGTTGLLVPPQDPERMAQAVLSLLADRDRAAAMGHAARRWVEADLTTTAMCERLLHIIGD